MNNIVKFEWADLPTRRELHRRVDNLPLSAEHKLALTRLSDLTARVGDQVIDVGRRIVAFAFELARHFPSLTLTVILALIINVLLASVPLLGPLLQPLFGPVVLAAGVALGGLAELYDGDMRGRVGSLSTEFQRIFA